MLAPPVGRKLVLRRAADLLETLAGLIPHTRKLFPERGELLVQIAHDRVELLDVTLHEGDLLFQPDVRRLHGADCTAAEPAPREMEKRGTDR